MSALPPHALTAAALTETAGIALALLEPYRDAARRAPIDQLAVGGPLEFLNPTIAEHLDVVIATLTDMTAELNDLDEDGGALGGEATFDPKAIQ